MNASPEAQDMHHWRIDFEHGKVFVDGVEKPEFAFPTRDEWLETERARTVATVVARDD